MLPLEVKIDSPLLGIKKKSNLSQDIHDETRAKYKEDRASKEQLLS